MMVLEYVQCSSKQAHGTLDACAKIERTRCEPVRGLVAGKPWGEAPRTSAILGLLAATVGVASAQHMVKVAGLCRTHTCGRKGQQPDQLRPPLRRRVEVVTESSVYCANEDGDFDINMAHTHSSGFAG